jgi:uncharacterized protein (TIGR02646 family)
MKRVPMLDEEPTELARWRADNPQDDGATGSHAKGAWDRFRRSGAYRALVDRLLTRQQGLCGYCEQRLSQRDGTLVVNDYQVEHVLAKSGGPGRVLDWRNLMLCCWGGTWGHHKDSTRYTPSARGTSNMSCGQAKGDADVVGPCDPRLLPWQRAIVRVDVDGHMKPDEDACRHARIDPERLAHVIEVLGLNCERLRVARRNTIQNLDHWLKDLLEEVFDANHLPADKLAQAFRLHVEGRLRPDRHGHSRRFWTTERLYLGDEAEAWIRDNAPLLHFG